VSVGQRRLLLGIVILLVVATGVLVVQPPGLNDIWPFADTTPMTYYFVASILLAGGASIAWCVYADEPGALVGVGVDGVTIFVPMTAFVLIAGLSRGDSALTISAVGAAAVAVAGAGLAWWARQFPIRDSRATPLFAKASMGLFAVVLVSGGALLVAGTKFLPWPVTDDLSVVVGLFFIGAAAYFAYGVARPIIGNAFGQLLGFLAYDLVLIVPFLVRLPTIQPELRTNLLIYIGVLLYSGLVAIVLAIGWGGLRQGGLPRTEASTGV
jgi:hypothetical protein